VGSIGLGVFHERILFYATNFCSFPFGGGFDLRYGGIVFFFSFGGLRCHGEKEAIRFLPFVRFGFCGKSRLLSSFRFAKSFLCALGNMPQYRKYTLLSFWLLVLGGFVFGPIVQKYAFDIFWSGFPFGGDLTDNKTLFAAIALLVAVVTGKKKWNRWAVVVAMAVMFAIFSIPHSMRGSELNHQTGVIESAK
jgi:hypothetical protein